MTTQATLTAATTERVTRAQLAGIPTPLSTRSHRPIAHAELVEIMEDRLAAAGYRVTGEEYAVQRGGLRLFGTLDLENGETPGAGMGLALGFRHANDRTMSLQIVGGARVFVCTNLALSGEAKVFRNRHTHGVMGRLREALGRYVGGLGRQVEMLKDRFGVWQAAGLTDDAAKVVIYDAIAGGVVPSRVRPEIHEAYFSAERLGYPDCAPRTKMGLHNAFTRALKALNPGPAFEANLGLTRLLG